MKTANYFNNKTVVIAEGPRPVGQTFKVSGKKEAREIAAKHNAQPWNF